MDLFVFCHYEQPADPVQLTIAFLFLSANRQPQQFKMTNTSTDLVTGSAHLDLAGNLIIKARFNNNFKKTTINNDELTYDELILMLQRLFNGRFDAKDDVKLKYRDEDGDLVDIDNDSDLKAAIQSNRYLKLVISLADEEDDVSLLDDKISLSKKEFRKLLETMEHILENLKTNGPVKPENSTNSSFEPLNNEPAHTMNSHLNNLTLSDSKEFDPLVNKNNDLKSDRSHTAQSNLEEDSIKSLDSSSLHQQQQQQQHAERQPATLQPSVQQFQPTQNLQSKILVGCACCSTLEIFSFQIITKCEKLIILFPSHSRINHSNFNHRKPMCHKINRNISH